MLKAGVSAAHRGRHRVGAGRAGLLLAIVLACGGCTPHQQALLSLLPDGTIPVLLSHFDRVDDTNRRRVAEFEQRRDWDGLSRFAEDNLKRDPSNSDWWLVAGYANSQAGNRRRAIECYNEVVRLSPEDDLGWPLLAQAYRLDKQPERALQILDRALVVRRDIAPTWYLQGEIFGDLGRLEPAAAAYSQAIKIDQRYELAWLGLGRTYLRMGRTVDARKIAQVLEQLNPAMARDFAATLQPEKR